MSPKKTGELYTSRDLLEILSKIMELMSSGKNEKLAMKRAFHELGPFISAEYISYFEREHTSGPWFKPTVTWCRKRGKNSSAGTMSSDAGKGDFLTSPSTSTKPGFKNLSRISVDVNAEWFQTLQNGGTIHSNIKNSPDLPDTFGSAGLVVLVPIRRFPATLSFICSGLESDPDSEEEVVSVVKTILCTLGAHMQSRSNESALNESEERYNQIFRNNPAVKLLLEPETGQIIDANRAACRFYGYSYKTFRTRNIKDINTLASDEVKSKMDEALAGSGSLFQFNHRLASGEIREVEVSTAPVYLGGKKLLYSIIHDITDRKLAEEQLKVGEMLFRQFVYSTPTAVAMFDTNMNYLLTSKRWAEDFKLVESELPGKNFFDTSPGIPLVWKRVFARALEGKTTSNEDELIILPDGSREWIRWEIQPWFQKKDSIGGIIIFTELITERKKAIETEKTLISQKARLAARLEAIEEERRKISRELHDGLGQMITAAVMSLEMIENTVITNPENAIEHAGKVKSLLDTTIQEIRNISQDLRPAILDDFGLIPALRHLCEDFSRISGMEITFETFDFDERLPPGLEITCYRISQEAISNIMRHSGASEAGIQIYRRTDTLLVMIHDNGKGMDYATIRSDLSRAGSGLTNIKERVELHNGRVQIESRPGQGMELIIEIPLKSHQDVAVADIKTT